MPKDFFGNEIEVGDEYFYTDARHNSYVGIVFSIFIFSIRIKILPESIGTLDIKNPKIGINLSKLEFERYKELRLKCLNTLKKSEKLRKEKGT